MNESLLSLQLRAEQELLVRFQFHSFYWFCSKIVQKLISSKLEEGEKRQWRHYYRVSSIDIGFRQRMDFGEMQLQSGFEVELLGAQLAAELFDLVVDALDVLLERLIWGKEPFAELALELRIFDGRAAEVVLAQMASHCSVVFVESETDRARNCATYKRWEFSSIIHEDHPFQHYLWTCLALGVSSWYASRSYGAWDPLFVAGSRCTGHIWT